MAKRLKYTVGNFALRVRRSGTGRGLFTEQEIPKGACIIEYTGRPATQKEIEDDTAKYLFEVNSKLTINGNITSNIARFINHSCRPNCEAVGPADRVFIVAARRIKAGEELTYHYGKDYFTKILKPKGCRCAKGADSL